jgi:flagellar hook-associated protein 3 FlgL
MRVTEGLITQKYLVNQAKNAEKKLKLQTQLATNSKLDTISDNLPDALESIKINAQMKKNETFLKNSENSKNFLDASLDSLENATTEMQKIIVALQDVHNAINGANISTYAAQIKNSLASIVQSVSGKQNGMYLFGGTNNNQPPVTLDVNGHAVTTTADVSGSVEVQLSNEIKETINIPGNDLFATGIFEKINEILTTLEGGNIPSEAQRLAIDNSYSSLLNLQSIAAEKVNRMDDIAEVLTRQQDNLTELLRKKQSIDPAALIIELQNQDYLLQLSNKILASSYPSTVFDYL